MQRSPLSRTAPPLTLGGKLAAIGIALTVVRAAVGICVRSATRATDFLRRGILDRHCAGHRAAVAAADSQGRFVERAAARRRPIRCCRGVKSNRCVFSAGPQPARRCRGGAASDVVGRRHRRRCCLQPRQQSAGGSDRGGHKSCCAGAAAGGRRDPDRRRSRAQSFRDGLARHHPVADRIAPRGRERYASSVSQAWPHRHAACAGAVAAGLVGDSH